MTRGGYIWSVVLFLLLPEVVFFGTLYLVSVASGGNCNEAAPSPCIGVMFLLFFPGIPILLLISSLGIGIAAWRRCASVRVSRWWILPIICLPLVVVGAVMNGPMLFSPRWGVPFLLEMGAGVFAPPAALLGLLGFLAALPERTGPDRPASRGAWTLAIAAIVFVGLIAVPNLPFVGSRFLILRSLVGRLYVPGLFAAAATVVFIGALIRIWRDRRRSLIA